MREPDLKIKGDYLWRWYIIPRNRFFNIYLHRFGRSDDKVMHDHPWWSLSFLIKGDLWEDRKHKHFRRLRKFFPYLRRPEQAHRIILNNYVSKFAWTIFITGPRVREWGFHCPKGWRIWTDYVDKRDVGKVGDGCS